MNGKTMDGIGYQAYKTMRIEKGTPVSDLESEGNERFVIYFGRPYLRDYKSGFKSTGHLKIGRAKYATALMRSRNQSGGDFRIHAEIVLENNEATRIAENKLKEKLKNYNLTLNEGQREIYNIDDENLKSTVDDIVNTLKKEMKLKVLEVNFYTKEKERQMTKVSDKLTKVNENFTINMYDNGYMVEVGGRDHDDDWKNTKIVCNSLEEVLEVVREVDSMPRND